MRQYTWISYRDASFFDVRAAVLAVDTSELVIASSGSNLRLELTEPQLRTLQVAIQRRLTAIDNATEALCSCTDPVRPEGEGCKVHVGAVWA